jgi:XisI protein
MDRLTSVVRTAVMGYARKGLNSQSHLTHNDDDTVFSVVTVTQKNTSFVSLLVRVAGETVIIEQDRNDKPLVDALVQAGIPRSQIILAYAGEPVPATI